MNAITILINFLRGPIKVEALLCRHVTNGSYLVTPCMIAYCMSLDYLDTAFYYFKGNISNIWNNSFTKIH